MVLLCEQQQSTWLRKWLQTKRTLETYTESMMLSSLHRPIVSLQCLTSSKCYSVCTFTINAAENFRLIGTKRTRYKTLHFRLCNIIIILIKYLVYNYILCYILPVLSVKSYTSTFSSVMWFNGLKLKVYAHPGWFVPTCKVHVYVVQLQYPEMTMLFWCSPIVLQIYC